MCARGQENKGLTQIWWEIVCAMSAAVVNALLVIAGYISSLTG